MVGLDSQISPADGATRWTTSVGPVSIIYFQYCNTDLIDEIVCFLLWANVGDVDIDAPGADVHIYPQMEELIQSHHNPFAVQIEVHFERQLVLVTDLEHCCVITLQIIQT